MTPQKMTAEELDSFIEKYVKSHPTADVIRANIAALRARVEAEKEARERSREVLTKRAKKADADVEEARRRRDEWRARAEAAEADNAAKDEAFRLYVEERGVEHDDIPGTEIPCPDDDTCECPRIFALNAAFRTGNVGTGYRARVRAELLRELADELREEANIVRDALPDMARQADAIAEGFEGQATREEHGATSRRCHGCAKCCVNEQQACQEDAKG